MNAFQFHPLCGSPRTALALNSGLSGSSQPTRYKVMWLKHVLISLFLRICHFFAGSIRVEQTRKKIRSDLLFYLVFSRIIGSGSVQTIRRGYLPLFMKRHTYTSKKENDVGASVAFERWGPSTAKQKNHERGKTSHVAYLYD